MDYNHWVDQDPENEALHDARYEWILKHGNLEQLRFALADSARRLRNEHYVTLIAALEENSQNFEEALKWREMACELKSSAENRRLLERCRAHLSPPEP